MTTTTSSSPAVRRVDLAPARRVRTAPLALLLAVLSVPGVIVTWDTVPGGGFVTGVPLAIAAIVLGLRTRHAGGRDSRMAAAAIVLGVLALAWVCACIGLIESGVWDA
jgi:multisubunit Na+/H+ antiporter MnhB subunit